ncbi:MAG TPA: DUF542 domain-containing protein [Gemmatimonadales bacterium]|nr:DUF542 domain-containing protein [Gemmatimonadales bacterium]
MTEATELALDVRPILAEGGEPFADIMAAADRVAPGGVLVITAPFEPVPLYGVMSKRGFGHRTTAVGAAEFVVRFTRLDITETSTVAEVYGRFPSTAPVLARHGLDLCCGGAKQLGFVAEAHGLELPRLLAELQDAALGGAGGA